ncbi:NnrU family protein [Paragemmobacter straminiformis]|uniref:NnrU family protein n=1 Tax=Paragemmobacter straminiformis TaxID=2045119 RepID=A0A842I4F1_9RHOB|nr:NnrU family protein [Gemmobacter straminiformis]
MLLIILGLVLWTGAHFLKRLAPEARARMGNGGKAVLGAVTIVGVVCMILGYRGVDQVDLWYPPAFMIHINNTLMLLAFYLYAASGLKTAITRKIRHPQLTAVKTWAVAHLLVNGDLASVLLFGGLLAWAVGSVILINRAEPQWTKNPPVPASKEVMAVVGALVVVGIVMMIHNWLGVQPWG